MGKEDEVDKVDEDDKMDKSLFVLLYPFVLFLPFRENSLHTRQGSQWLQGEVIFDKTIYSLYTYDII